MPENTRSIVAADHAFRIRSAAARRTSRSPSVIMIRPSRPACSAETCCTFANAHSIAVTLTRASACPSAPSTAARPRSPPLFISHRPAHPRTSASLSASNPTAAACSSSLPSQIAIASPAAVFRTVALA